MQIRKKYYVNSMVISCTTCQKEEKECIWVKYVVDAVLLRLKFSFTLRIFSVKFKFQDFQD